MVSQSQKKKETVGTWPFDREVVYPEQNFAVWQTGGAKHNMTIYENQLYSGKNTITLYIFDLGVPETWDDLAEFETVDDYKEYNYLLTPTFK